MEILLTLPLIIAIILAVGLIADYFLDPQSLDRSKEWERRLNEYQEKEEE